MPMAHIHHISGEQQDLKDKFLRQVRLTTESAELGDNVLIILISHGNPDTYGVYLGSGTDQLLSLEGGHLKTCISALLYWQQLRRVRSPTRLSGANPADTEEESSRQLLPAPSSKPWALRL